MLTDTYTYDAYGTLLNHTGETDNDYLYTGEQYNFTTKLYYLRARYMSPETGIFISMDTYFGTLDNPVSLHKYLYANANPVMYTDPTGYFSIMETQLAQTIKSTIQSASVPAMNFHKIMSWANMAVTAYDIGCQLRLFISGDGNFFGLVIAIAGGLVSQAMLNCVTTAIFGKAAATILKLVGIGQDASSLIEAIKGGDPVEIIFESMRLVVSLFTLKCQCFTGDTLVSTVDGDRRIDEIQVGDYIWSYDTETGERVEAKVTNVSITEADILVHVYTSDGEEIKTTMFHPFYVKNVADDKDISYNSGEWKAASNLSAGDELLTEDGKIVYVREVRIERLEESIKVYNLEVEGLHTYYVGEGVLVHKMCDMTTTEKIPVWKGSGPEPGILGINSNSISNSAINNYNPKEGIEFVFDATTNTFVVGKSKYNKGWGSLHQKLADSIGDNQSASTTLGGVFSRGSDGRIYTNENSGHFGKNWTPALRAQFIEMMRKYGVEVIHETWE